MADYNTAGNKTAGHDVEGSTNNFFAEFEEKHIYPREDFEAIGEAFAQREIEGYDTFGEEEVTVYVARWKL